MGVYMTDFFEHFKSIPTEDYEQWQRFRHFLQENVSPIIDAYWNQGVFPTELIPHFGRFLEQEFGSTEYVYPPPNALPFRLFKMELGRIDPSMASFACIGVWQWVLFPCLAQKSKKRNGCHQCKL